ncbi:MAG: hypothetical protein CME68_05200, partial [Halobacteriovoraceae bacterium]|nr:hypothetical protein [Halobacteriovoraceae bacterium]
MKKSTFTKYKLLIIVGLFCWIKNVMSTVSNEEKIKPKKTPVELVHGKSVKLTRMPFFKGKSISIKLLFNKDDLTNGLYVLQKGEVVPKHYNDYDKAFYVYKGKVDLYVKGVKKTLVKGDSVYIPKGSVTELTQKGGQTSQIYFFYPKGPLKNIKQYDGGSLTKARDPNGSKVRVIFSKNVAWENWDGKIKDGKVTPLAWKTLIENKSMILGITKIDPGYDVDSHYHRQTQVVIFERGQGQTHIKDGKYVPVGVESVIYPPTYS